jgi:hydroxymethylbilane synthase
MREDRRDVLISRHGESFSALPFGGIVGTSSFRRASQVKMFRPDLRVEIIRGNVDTRLRKLYDPVGQFSAIIVAAAGVKRLGLEERISEFFAEELWLPSAGQGALAVQCLADRAEIVELLKGINDPSTSSEVRTERAFIDTLGGSCNAAIGASAKIEGGSQISLQVVLFNISSLEEILADRRSAISIRDCAIFLEGNAPVERGEELGRELAEKMLRLKG